MAEHLEGSVSNWGSPQTKLLILDSALFTLAKKTLYWRKILTGERSEGTAGVGRDS